MNQVPTLEEAREYIYSLDFDQIINKLITRDNWSEKHVKKVCELYRNFLFLNKKYINEYDQLPPSEDIDEFWHNHILDTKKYKHDCKMIFGRFFHHYPYLGVDGKTSMQDLNNFFEIVQQLYFKEFGEYIYNVRTNSLKQWGQFGKSLLGLLKDKNV